MTVPPEEPIPPTIPIPSSSSTDAAQHSTFSLSEELKKVKKMKAVDRKNEKGLSVELRNRLYQLREQKEVGRFLLPDAMEKKRKRKASPLRGPCPLLPGTPEIPPPRIPQPWKSHRISGQYLHEKSPSPPPATELEKNSPLPGPSGASEACTIESEVKISEGSLHLENPVLFSPSTGILRVDHFDGCVLDSQIQLIGFSPAPSVQELPGPSAESLGNSSPSLNDTHIFDDEIEQQIREWEQTVGVDIGSDIEDVPDDDLIDFSTRRNASEFPSVLDDLPSDVFSQAVALDDLDDRALQKIATEEMLHFEWSSDRGTFVGEREAFIGQAGPTFPVEGLSPLQIFTQIWDDKIIQEIIRETNRYANNILNDPRLPRNARMRKWRDVTESDLWIFFGIIMLQGIVPLPVEKEFWNPCLPYVKLENFDKLMPFSRFLLIKKCLHFVDNNNLPQVPDKEKKISKVKPIIDHLNKKISSLYLPEQDIAIDESLLLWKGRLSFVQLIANKTAKVGIKSFELCESKSGYLWKMIIYTGKKNEDEQEPAETQPVGATSRVVLDLVTPLLDKGHTLVMDNFYNSPLLARMLKARKTDVMGTLRLNRQFVPESLRTKSKSNMSTGEVAFSQTAELSIVVWKDSNVVSLLSTYHKIEVGGKEKYGQYKYKPSVVLDYNLSMGGVDKKDQLLQAFPIERVRNNAWYKKLFRRLFNVSIHNSFVIFCSKTKILHREFRVKLADEIIKKYLILKPKPPTNPPRIGHYPQKVSTGRPRCKMCAKAKLDTRTQWKCDTCNVSLCIIGCFREYHVSLQ